MVTINRAHVAEIERLPTKEVHTIGCRVFHLTQAPFQVPRHHLFVSIQRDVAAIDTRKNFHPSYDVLIEFEFVAAPLLVVGKDYAVLGSCGLADLKTPRAHMLASKLDGWHLTGVMPSGTETLLRVARKFLAYVRHETLPPLKL